MTLDVARLRSRIGRDQTLPATATAELKVSGKLTCVASLSCCIRAGENLRAPADAVTVAFDESTQIQSDTRHALTSGLAGKLCSHPRQVPLAHAAWAPSDKVVTWAHLVLAADQAFESAAVQVDGRGVDLSVVLSAQRMRVRRYEVDDR